VPLAPQSKELGEVDERILNAARKIFVEGGFEGASIDEIADAARAGKPTIYARFGDKRALFTAVIDARRRGSHHAVQGEAPTGATIEKRLAILANGHLRASDLIHGKTLRGRRSSRLALQVSANDSKRTSPDDPRPAARF